MLATHGIAIDRSTLAFWVGYAAHELKPLWHRLRQLLLASSKLCVDETPAPVLDPGRGRTKTGYFWALSRDDRPWAGPDPPGVVYAYAPGRGAIHGLRLLAGYRGIIHCDGYTAKALRYALRHWDGLTLYLDDGRIEMDTNAVERAMRPIKLNAKNSLFAGCDEGAEHWALLASLIETCKLNGVSAEHWLADVLAKLVNGWPAARLDELLPWASTYTMHIHDPRLAA